MKVSVLMPVYNGAQYLQEAIDSILAQTYKDFEFIIVDDGSIDKSATIIAKNAAKDSRIVSLRNEKNSGICVTLNKGLGAAKGEYIIRMDCDDISLPERIERQVAFMDERMDVGVAGCNVDMFHSEHAENHKVYTFDIDSYACRAGLLFATCVAHPAVIIRKSVLVMHGIQYNDYFRGMEDYYLWWQISKYAQITNVPELLLRYRLHAKQVTQTQVNEDFIRRQREFLTQRVADMGVSLSTNEINVVERYLVANNSFDDEKLDAFIIVLHKLLRSLYNTNRSYYNAQKLVIGKAISYAYDLSRSNLNKGNIYYMWKAYYKGCMSGLWFLKRIYHHFK